MKQHITPKQLNELSDAGKKRLIEIEKDKPDWYCGYYNNIPKLTIGQMIEFLGDDWGGKITGVYLNKNMCDALWEAVKEVLNETSKYS